MAWVILSTYKRDGRAMARAECACGAVCDVRLDHLRSGKSSQCRDCRDAGNRADVDARIAAQTSRNESGCLVWSGTTSSGYPFMWVNGKQRRLHRWALERALGRPLEASECACHRCDNPLCIEPSHLFVGAQADNVADMIAKGRNSRGSAHAEAMAAANLERVLRGEPAPKKLRAKRRKAAA